MDNNQLAAGLRTSSAWTEISGGSITDTDTWHLAVLNWDGATMSLWLDGIQVASTSFSATLGGNNYATYWGCDWNGTSGYFDGDMDDGFIFSRALTQTEIAGLYAGTLGAIAPSIDPRQAVVAEAFYALGTPQGNACNHSTITDNIDSSIQDCVGSWNYLYLTDQTYPGSSAMSTLVPLYGTNASLWAVLSDGSAYYDAQYDTGIPPSFYTGLEDYAYYGNVGRGGECRFFANFVYYRALALLGTPPTGAFPAYGKMWPDGDAGIETDLKQAVPGDILTTKTPYHTAIVVGVVTDGSGTVTALNLIDSNWLPEDGNSGREMIEMHRLPLSFLADLLESHNIQFGIWKGAYTDLGN